MMSLLRKRALGAAVALGVVGLAGRASAQPTQVTFSLPGINIAFLAFYMADDLHLWSDQGLQVKTIMLQGTASTNAVIAGSAEFAVSSGASITRAWARGQRLHAIATAINQTLEWVMIRKEIAEAEHFNPNAPMAERAKILKGRKIAIGGVASLPDAVLKAVASEAGIPARRCDCRADAAARDPRRVEDEADRWLLQLDALCAAGAGRRLGRGGNGFGERRADAVLAGRGLDGHGARRLLPGSHRGLRGDDPWHR
jgi:hypothetical protein